MHAGQLTVTAEMVRAPVDEQCALRFAFAPDAKLQFPRYCT